MMFFTSSQEFPFQKGETVDIAATLDISEYGGNRSVSVIVKDVKASADDTEAILESGRIFEDFCRTAVKNKNELRTILPERADFAEVYRYLRSQGEFHHKPEHMVHVFGNRISYGKIRVILEAMKQLGLIEFAEGIKSSRISLLSVSGRVDLETADIIRKIREALQ